MADCTMQMNGSILADFVGCGLAAEKLANDVIRQREPAI